MESKVVHLMKLIRIVQLEAPNYLLIIDFRKFMETFKDLIDIVITMSRVKDDGGVAKGIID